jgi:hypothetical protein
MVTDFLTLLRRDHHELVGGLAELLTPAITVAELRGTLDGVRLGLTAHVEAEDIVLAVALAGRTTRPLEALVREVRASHLAQERALASLVCAPPGSAAWQQHASELRRAVRDHAVWEESWVVPAIREAAPDAYARLAGAFATERLRQLTMQQPSGPIYAVAS